MPAKRKSTSKGRQPAKRAKIRVSAPAADQATIQAVSTPLSKPPAILNVAETEIQTAVGGRNDTAEPAVAASKNVTLRQS